MKRSPLVGLLSLGVLPVVTGCGDASLNAPPGVDVGELTQLLTVASDEAIESYAAAYSASAAEVGFVRAPALGVPMTYPEDDGPERHSREAAEAWDRVAASMRTTDVDWVEEGGSDPGTSMHKLVLRIDRILFPEEMRRLKEEGRKWIASRRSDEAGQAAKEEHSSLVKLVTMLQSDESTYGVWLSVNATFHHQLYATSGHGDGWSVMFSAAGEDDDSGGTR